MTAFMEYVESVRDILTDEHYKQGRNIADQCATMTDNLRGTCERWDRERGIVPQGWTHMATCKQCGPVWLQTSGTFDGCPWCANRVKGLPIP